MFVCGGCVNFMYSNVDLSEHTYSEDSHSCDYYNFIDMPRNWMERTILVFNRTPNSKGELMRFPTKQDYPAGLFENAFWVEGCGSAYFEGNPITKSLFRKRIMTVLSMIDSEIMYNLILDIGTGVGYLLPALSKVGRSVVGTDVDSSLLNHVAIMLHNKGIYNVALLRDDIQKSKLDDRFDLILCLSNLEHVDPYVACKNIKKIASNRVIFGFPIETGFTKFIKDFEIRFIRPKAYKKLKEGIDNGLFKHHISDYKKIEESIRKNFMVLNIIDIKFCGLRLYRIMDVGVYD